MVIPIRVGGPATARDALGFGAWVQAGRAASSRIEGVPLIATLAEPAIMLTRRPAVKRATDARAEWILALVEIGFARSLVRAVGPMREHDRAHASPSPQKHLWRNRGSLPTGWHDVEITFGSGLLAAITSFSENGHLQLVESRWFGDHIDRGNFAIRNREAKHPA